MATDPPAKQGTAAWWVLGITVVIAGALCLPASWQLVELGSITLDTTQFGSLSLELRHLLAGLVGFGGFSVSIVPRVLQFMQRRRLTTATATATVEAEQQTANNNTVSSNVSVTVPAPSLGSALSSIEHSSADPAVTLFARSLASEVQQVLREELSPSVVEAVDKTQVYCFTSILFEVTKKIAQRAKTMGREISSEEHPQRYRVKHRDQLETFYLQLVDITEMQWFETAASRHAGTIEKKRQVLLDSVDRFGQELARLSDFIEMDQKKT